MSPRAPREERESETSRRRATAPAPDPDDRFSRDDEPEPPEPDEPAYRTRRRPVQVRRRGGSDAVAWLRRHAGGLAAVAGVLALAGVVAAFLMHSGWFVLSGSDQIAVEGAAVLPAATVRQVFGGDFGRNIFFIPLHRRQSEVDAIPWVRQATILRIWPDQLQVRLVERTPVALARCGATLCLIDRDGALMQRLGGPWDFPVLTGLAGANRAAIANPPALLQQRRAQLQLYLSLQQALDANAAHGSAELSEVNVADPADLVVMAQPAGQASPTLVHLGNQDLMRRYQYVRDNIANWRRQYPTLQYVDLRFPPQVILPTAPPAPPQKKTGH